MATMKAAVIREAGGPDVLKIESLPIPTPKTGEVLIRVKAFGLNLRDVHAAGPFSRREVPASSGHRSGRCG
jgi:NADPH:quinone reductase-like Zn-dependent oxidoreductase